MYRKTINAFKKALKEIENKSSNKQLFKFGILLLIFFIACFVYSFFFVQEKMWWLIMLSIFFAISLLMPSLLRWPYRVWMLVALVLGFFVSRILLFLLFYFFITPIGLLYRFFKGDILNKEINKKQSSYWLDYKKKSDVKVGLKQQF